MNNKLQDYLIGIHKPDFCDQQYLRDRDEICRASSKEEAIAIWVSERQGWLREDEHKFIKVFGTFEWKLEREHYGKYRDRWFTPRTEIRAPRTW